jgi:ABC-type sugar transport system ATPase subunit
VPKISFRNVKKVYPSGTYALNNINFDIEQGDFVSIIGESGGGKTTLLKLISGLEKATSGEIYFDDEISNFIKVAQRDVAFVFQDYTIYPNMTVFENILMALNKHKISYEAKCEIAWDIIKKMNLEMIHGEVPNSLSFGQCQKVALAKTLVRKPKIVLFDEPLSNIDASAKQEYKKLILNAKEVLPDSTFIYVTHSINDALQLSNKIMVIHNGEILQFDEKQMVFEFPNSTLVADYILEGNQKYRGQIINGFFISDKKEIKLDEFQLSSLHQQNLDNVICYSLGNINVFFDETGQSLTCFKKILKIHRRWAIMKLQSFWSEIYERISPFCFQNYGVYFFRLFAHVNGTFGLDVPPYGADFRGRFLSAVNRCGICLAGGWNRHFCFIVEA